MTTQQPQLRKWSWRDIDRPWFDRPDSLELLERRRVQERLSDSDVDRLRHWLTDGYCVVKGLVADSAIDAMERDLDDLWVDGGQTRPVELLGVRVEPDSVPVNLHHKDLQALDEGTRRAMQARSNWRIHGFHLASPAAAVVFAHAGLKALASLILGREVVPSYSINFTHGSEQELHTDTAVFHVVPPNYLVGAWLACEDIKPGSGALVVYPGSHRGPMYPAFDNYPQTNLRTWSDQADYARFMHEQSERYPPLTFLAKKGDVLLWHGMLIHGGSRVEDSSLSRRSFVCHYIPPGMDVATQMVGPFNW
jgi:phytanoyl-CoA hydroxylase